MTLKQFGDLKEGDIIIGSNGLPTTVLKTYEPHLPESMYEITFDNGQKIEASGNHLWYIETNLHKNLHKQRINNANKEFKKITPQMEEQLYKNAQGEQKKETSIMEIAQLLNMQNNNNALKELIRIAESIGPIAEEKTILQDLSSEEQITQQTIKMYDSKKFAQQILALKDKKYRKTHPVIIGAVVTTETLTHLSMEVEIPEIQPL